MNKLICAVAVFACVLLAGSGARGQCELMQLVASDAAAHDGFGVSVAVSADEKTSVVGAVGNDDACPDDITCNSGWPSRASRTKWKNSRDSVM